MTTARIAQANIEVTERKLASWKSIAEYFNCDERTAKRWERERELPVHRAPGGKRSVVIAYTSELDNWLRTWKLKENTDIAAVEKGTTPSQGPALSFTLESPATTGEPDTREFRRMQSGRPLEWAAACAAVLLVAVLALWTLKGRHAVPTSSSGTLTSSAALQHLPAPGAEALYLQGRYFWNLRTSEGLNKAIDAYTRAIVKDPSYADAYAGLAETYELLPQFGNADLGESLTKAKDAADRAISLDPNLAAAHRAKAFALFYWDWDISGSDAEFRRALALDPNSAQTRQWYASTLANRLEGSECLKQIDDALRLSPTSAAIATNAALFHATFGDFNAGMRELKEIEQTQPTLATPADFLRKIDFAIGDYPGYIAETRRYASITRIPDDIALADAVARGWAQGGRTGLLQARARVLKAAFDRGQIRATVWARPSCCWGVKRCVAVFQGGSQQALHPTHHHVAMSVGENTRARSRLCRTLLPNSRAPSRRPRGSPDHHSSDTPSATVIPAFTSGGTSR